MVVTTGPVPESVVYMQRLVNKGKGQEPLSLLTSKAYAVLQVLEVVTIGFVDDDAMELVRVEEEVTADLRVLTNSCRYD